MSVYIAFPRWSPTVHGALYATQPMSLLRNDLMVFDTFGESDIYLCWRLTWPGSRGTAVAAAAANRGDCWRSRATGWAGRRAAAGRRVRRDGRPSCRHRRRRAAVAVAGPASCPTRTAVGRRWSPPGRRPTRPRPPPNGPCWRSARPAAPPSPSAPCGRSGCATVSCKTTGRH